METCEKDGGGRGIRPAPAASVGEVGTSARTRGAVADQNGPKIGPAGRASRQCPVCGVRFSTNASSGRTYCAEPCREKAMAERAKRCRRGHDLTNPDNLRVNSDGKRACVVCHEIAARARAEAIRAGTYVPPDVTRERSMPMAEVDRVLGEAVRPETAMPWERKAARQAVTR